MIWLALKAFAGRAWAWVARNPLLALCAALAALSAYSWHGWSASERHRKADAVAFQQASDKNRADTEALRATERARYQEQASHADASHTADLARVRTATDDYVQSHRVQPSGQCTPGAISSPSDAGNPEAVPPALVVVAEPDVRLAGEWQAYGVSCHDYLQSITKDSK